jgi:hypothetical protein
MYFSYIAKATLLDNVAAVVDLPMSSMIQTSHDLPWLIQIIFINNGANVVTFPHTLTDHK